MAHNPSTIGIVNKSTTVTDAEVTILSNAINKILPIFCNDWYITPIKTMPFAKGGKITTPINVTIYDDPDISGAYGYHSEENDTPYGKVFSKFILDNGGVVLYSPTTPLTVAQVVCHEVLEMLIDITANRWWSDYRTGIFYAAEVCDPVQGNSLTVAVNTTPVGSRTVTTVQVGLSDWILPTWTDSQALAGPYNHLATLSAPFTIDKNGYTIQANAGNIRSVFGDKVHEFTTNIIRGQFKFS